MQLEPFVAPIKFILLSEVIHQLDRVTFDVDFFRKEFMRLGQERLVEIMTPVLLSSCSSLIFDVG